MRTSHLAAPAGQANRSRDLRGRGSALHGHGIDQHGNGGKTARQHMQDVANRGAAGRGDDADSLGDHGQGAFTLRREQAFRRKLRRQFFELALQSS